MFGISKNISIFVALVNSRAISTKDFIKKIAKAIPIIKPLFKRFALRIALNRGNLLGLTQANYTSKESFVGSGQKFYALKHREENFFLRGLFLFSLLFFFLDLFFFSLFSFNTTINLI